MTARGEKCYTDGENCCAFRDEGGNTIYDDCYSDRFCVGFVTFDGLRIDRDRVQNRAYRRFQKGTLFRFLSQIIKF